MTLEALIRALAPREVTGAAGPVEITDLSYDTRTVVPGAAFFCVRGERVDGHDLAAEALERGAAALVVERELELGSDVLRLDVPRLDVPSLVVDDVRAAMAVAADAYFGEPTKELELAGVTGTNGKTTTTFLLQSMLEVARGSAGLVGTVRWIVGGLERDAPFTTPEAIDLQRLFREMLAAGDRSAAVEASSHGAALRRLDRVRFDALVFTNLTQDHLDLHGTMEEYFQAKRRLFVGPEPPPAAVNVGTEWGRALARDLEDAHRAPLVTFGHSEDAEVRPEGLELTPRGSHFRAAGIEIETQLRGSFNVENVLGAVVAGLLLDLDERAIAEGVKRVSGVPGRFESIDEGQPFSVVVDYSHTPDSLETALRAARELGEGRVIAVFGAGGDRDRGKRPLMGKVAAELADLAIVTSDNPRTEDPLAIIADILQGTGVDVEIDPERASAIRRAVSLAEPGDVVLVAGKGHERGQETAGVVEPFDDRAVVREALAELRASR